MAQCTAPINGHRTESGRANCPVCGNRSGGYRYSGIPYERNNHCLPSSISSGQLHRRARWSPANSTLVYSPSDIRTLTPVRENIEKRAKQMNEAKDVFLCHAWDDRKGMAMEICNKLEANGVTVWFSEKEVALGAPLLREIDKGLANAYMGIVLVTPAFIERIKNGGIADKELSALLARDLLIPIVHNTSFEALRNASPLLGSRSGLSTSEESIDIIVSKIAELVKIEY